MNDLQKLFLTELEDMYDGEKQLVEALGEMEKRAQSVELRNAFREHRQQTKMHVNRLESVFRAMGEEPDRRKCKGLEGIIDEGQQIAKEFSKNSALDAGLIAAAQKVEHYEITSYGTLCAWAEHLNKPEVLSLLKQNLSEEKMADQLLTRVAETNRNVEAIGHDTEKKEGFLRKLAA